MRFGHSFFRKFEATGVVTLCGHANGCNLNGRTRGAVVSLQKGNF